MNIKHLILPVPLLLLLGCTTSQLEKTDLRISPQRPQPESIFNRGQRPAFQNNQLIEGGSPAVGPGRELFFEVERRF